MKERQSAALRRIPHGQTSERLPEIRRRAVAAAIASAGREAFAARPASELSGGERARGLLARAFATEAPILLADEPVAALDPHHQLRVINHLRAHAHAGAVVVAVMHDLALAARFADRVLMMREGRLVADGPARDVLNPDRLAANFGIEAISMERDNTLALIPWRALP